ncbi:pimeloyl-ACP methyl ester carboxylesterase [Bradyrhizobium elkanii]
MAFPQIRSPSFLSDCLVAFRRYPAITTVAGAATLVAATALVNRKLAKKALRDNPPQGRFVNINGVRLHYVERGNGRPLILFHGNGSMIQDFESSGLIDLAAVNYRVIVFDRPGFGHSLRPRNVVWTPEAQADLFKKALDRLSVQRAIVLGHSWGASVAVALAIRHPSFVEALVLASGYYFPTARADVAASSVPALPGLGDIISYTISPILRPLDVACHVAQGVRPAICSREIRRLSEGNGLPAITDPGQRGGVGVDDSRCVCFLEDL